MLGYDRWARSKGGGGGAENGYAGSGGMNMTERSTDQVVVLDTTESILHDDAFSESQF